MMMIIWMICWLELVVVGNRHVLAVHVFALCALPRGELLVCSEHYLSVDPQATQLAVDHLNQQFYQSMHLIIILPSIYLINNH